MPAAAVTTAPTPANTGAVTTRPRRNHAARNFESIGNRHPLFRLRNCERSVRCTINTQYRVGVGRNRCRREILCLSTDGFRQGFALLPTLLKPPVNAISKTPSPVVCRISSVGNEQTAHTRNLQCYPWSLSSTERLVKSKTTEDSCSLMPSRHSEIQENKTADSSRRFLVRRSQGPEQSRGFEIIIRWRIDTGKLRQLSFIRRIGKLLAKGRQSTFIIT